MNFLLNFVVFIYRYIQCIHQKLYHLTVADYEEFTSTIMSARTAFQITPDGNTQFKDWLQSIRRYLKIFLRKSGIYYSCFLFSDQNPAKKSCGRKSMPLFKTTLNDKGLIRLVSTQQYQLPQYHQILQQQYHQPVAPPHIIIIIPTPN